MSAIKRTAIFYAVAAAAFTLLLAQTPHARAHQSQTSQPAPQQQSHGSMPGMDMDDMHGGAPKNSEAAQSANDAMSGEHQISEQIALVPKVAGTIRRFVEGHCVAIAVKASAPGQ